MDQGEKEKFSVVADFSVDNTGPLPEYYGDHRLVIMARDPYWFFAYWEISPERAERLRQEHGNDVWDKGTLVLRVHDVTQPPQGGIESAPFFDVEVNRDAHDWYIKVSVSGRSYLVDMGLRLPDGHFLSLIRSNRIRLPVGHVSDQTDSQWMAVNISEQQEWEKMVQVAGVGTGNSKGGSVEFAKAMAQRWEFLRSVFSGSMSSWPSSKASISPATNVQPEKPS